MDAEDAVLLTLGFLGRVWGTTRLHKIIFLAKEEGGVDIDAEFIPYFYGPWSPDVQRAINALIDRHLVSVEVAEAEARNESPPRVYTLTECGREALRSILSKLSREELLRMKFIVSRYGFMPLTYLLTYIYAEYPEYTKFSVIRDKINEWRRFYGLKVGLGRKYD